jgi:hypothetical protein
MSVHIQADCRSGNSNGLPITARTLVSGQQSEVGHIDEGYIIEGPVLPKPHTATRAWHRSWTTHRQWRSIDIHKQWGLDRGLSDPVWSPDAAYLNQVCPDLIRLTYLASPLPSAQHGVLGTRLLAGHRVWHLREHLWFTLDLFVDSGSFRLRRLVLWDRPGPAAGSHHCPDRRTR